jgi:glyoxylase-like metal-dependent hydrolase (beta-lactamase superfamily II)
MGNPIASTRYRWQVLRAGALKLDGGGMFGLVPRVLWSRLAPVDERGRITLTHNCLLLERVDDASVKLVIETGSGDKFDTKNRDIFGLEDRWLADAVVDAGANPEQIAHVLVSHLHFDHAGGLTRRPREGETPGSAVAVLTFPNASVHAQRREWDDALANRSVMTRTYLRENLEPIRDRVKLHDSPAPFEAGRVPDRDEWPRLPVLDRLTEVLPGIFALLVPGHTWGQQALLFSDDHGRTIVFTPDVMPTIHHVGATYNLAYDVEPYVSSITRRWFLDAAVKHEWTLVLDHEPGNPVQQVEPDGKGWYRLIPAAT